MKLITYDAGSGARLGALVEDWVIDLNEASQGSLPADMRSFLELGEAGLDTARSIVEKASSAARTIPANEVKLLAPILNPSKVIAIGLNYMDHCREQNIEPPKAPIIFTKFTTSIIDPGDIIQWDPALTDKVDYEVELAVVIGRPTRLVSAAEALDYVAGYTICNDVSARDLQQGDGQWVRAKSLDTFCPLGPCLVTKDEITDPQNLSLRCSVNNEVRQDSNTNEMIFSVRELIEYTSRAFTLLPGDIITTGTPDGVGVFRSPPIFLTDGDEVVVEIEGIGQLSNRCEEVTRV
jgi:2-keto-4-pentenoate hydratase/2-oxohepta-3-ene-1,7-dioic acid hydratase in catechol pathway